MADNAGGVFLNTINGTPDIQVNEGIPNEKRVRDIALAVAESIQTVSVHSVLAEVDDVIYNEEESWSASDSTTKELQEFIEQLNTKQFQLIENL